MRTAAAVSGSGRTTTIRVVLSQPVIAITRITLLQCVFIRTPGVDSPLNLIRRECTRYDGLV
jgi:hypothetical protein